MIAKKILPNCPFLSLIQVKQGQRHLEIGHSLEARDWGRVLTAPAKAHTEPAVP